ncbi:MAG TPA: GNAT family N-acetyltransferase [Arthrobacter sp.]|nr:GNAT family N-acetyltransferase [Arthrobacter sp.]
MFAPETTAFWRAPFRGEALPTATGFSLAINPALAPDPPVEVLTRHDGTVSAAVTAEVATRLGLSGQGPGEEPPLDAGGFRGRLADAGLELYDPDCLFYFTEEASSLLGQAPTPTHVRQLTSADAAAFSRFEATASPADRDEAYVELGHWAVYGAFAGNDLASVASAYPWHGSRLADIGVLTVPAFRGRGLARDTVRAISRHAAACGYVPQYRCQPGNTGSRAVAAAADLTYFGLWEVVLVPPAEG